MHNYLAALATLAAFVPVAVGLQNAERHYGCVDGKNACIYPIDDANMQCGTIFDFQVEIHLPLNETFQSNWRNAIDIKLALPSGDVLTPESLFNKEPMLRSWRLEAFEDILDRSPDIYMSYAVVYRNVQFPSKYGKGAVKVEIRAKGIFTEVQYILREPTKRQAKNVVLFVGDGMALPMMAAARLVSRGMVQGKYNGLLNIEKLPNFGLQNPSGVDSIITDSANSASSLNTGHKSSVSALNVYADSGDDDFAHPKVETIAEHIKRRFGMSVGVISTAEVQDATPAAVWAHTRSRSQKAAITSQAINGCDECVITVAPDVLMGGGGRYFLPEDSIDGSNMYTNFSNAGYTVTHTRQEMMAAANDSDTKKLLTISHYENMDVWLDRNVYKENLNISENSPTGDGVAPTDQPNLDEMVMSAIKVLSRNENGFYLMVEAASVDKSAHAMDTPRLLSDLIELDNTVGMVKEWADTHGDDTLILVTADHAQGFDVFGTVDTEVYNRTVVASEEEPVSDVDHLCQSVTDNIGQLFHRFEESTTKQVVREANQARRLAIGIYNGAGYPDYEDKNGDNFPDSWDVRTVLAAGMNNFPDHTEDYRVKLTYREPAVATPVNPVYYLNNPLDAPNGIFLSGNLPPFSSTAVHSLQDVGIFATGPGAERVGGIVDNTEIFHTIAYALGFGTDGVIAPSRVLKKNVVKCINDENQCHCGYTTNDIVQCACKRFGPDDVYVMPSMKLCSKVDGNPIMQTADCNTVLCPKHSPAMYIPKT